jgi:CheY-like chemotaxis protein
MSRATDFTHRVLVVEDQPLIRHSLVTTLQARKFEVAEASDARSAIALFKDFDPDGLVIDIDLGAGPSGLDLLDAVRARNPAAPETIIPVPSFPGTRSVAGDPTSPVRSATARSRLRPLRLPCPASRQHCRSLPAT